MPNQNMLDFVLSKDRVVNMEYCATGVAKNKVYALVM